ncbi:hypothetical protein [Sphaerisporangium corydalis]|uniref:Uncharacterized protein n=1 Tax=Sphaerisporangium corydalis TaxID=1441875 RepID=A0ABV9E915_9ACTN|nr:hypothetical protein [Sphaerisporangium corydalis]
MDQRTDSSVPTVHHGDGEYTNGPWSRMESQARLFALLRYADEECGDEGGVELYGVQLPGGAAATITVKGRPHGCWSSIDRAADRLGLDLVWLDPSAGR